MQNPICEKAIKGATNPPLIQVVGMQEIQRTGSEIPAMIPRAGETAYIPNGNKTAKAQSVVKVRNEYAVGALHFFAERISSWTPTY